MIHSLLRKTRRTFHSIFSKLLLITVTTWFLILFTMIGAFFYSRHDSHSPWLKNMQLYFHYLERDLGSPPTKKNALLIYQKSGIHISFEARDKNESNWTTREKFPDFQRFHYRSLSQSERLYIGGRFGKKLLRLATQDGFLYFERANTRHDEDKHRSDHICMLTFLTLILLGSYLAIRRILRPLRWISTGVSEVRRGNLNHRVRIRGNDELTDLGMSFNQMTAELSTMIETKEHLLRDVSHELRSPLTRMRIALEMLENSELKNEILEDLEEMEQMVATILETARERHLTNNLELHKVDLEALLNSLSTNYQKSLPGVQYRSSGKPLFCMGDHKSFNTVFKNLIENGLKYSQEQDPEVVVELTLDNESIVVLVQDFGCGIAASELPHIFEPFYRVDKSRSKKSGGFGLGLSLCKTLIETFDGTIMAQSKLDSGTTIKVTLPRAQ